MKINSSSSSVFTQLNKTGKSLSKSFQQLSSGKRINQASDDPAGLAVAQSLSASQRSLKSINQGISLSQGALQTASSGLQSQLESLQRARELAVQSANGTLSDNDRANLQKEYDQTIQNVDQVSSQTTFNGNNLLDGSYTANVSTSENGSASLNINSSSSNALGVGTSGISTQADAQDAIESIDNAIAQVNSQQAAIGGFQNSLDYSYDANAVQTENLAAAQSQIEDAEIAETISNLKAEQVRQQAQILALQQEGKTKENFVKNLITKA